MSSDFNNKHLSTVSRRSMLGMGLATLVAPLVLDAEARADLFHANDIDDSDSVSEFYRLDKKLDKAASKKLYTPGVVAASSAPVQHMLFYFDDKKGLINPYNVTPDSSIQAGKKYSFEAEILNYHTSPTQEEGVWKKLQDDLQLQLSVSTRTQDDDLTWLSLSAMKVFLGGKKSGIDQRLQGFQSGIEPTKDFTGTSKIAIENGLGRLQLQVFAQQKKSFWSRLLNIANAATDSFAFGVLPIPKLLSQGVKFTTTVLDYMQAQNRLVPILTSGQLPFRLQANVKDADFTLRAGTWVAIERQFAMANVDGNSDIPSLKIAVAGQFYEMTDKSNKGVPADYLVCKFRFPEAKA